MYIDIDVIGVYGEVRRGKEVCMQAQNDERTISGEPDIKHAEES